jgi:hypothetical protein
MVNMHTQDIQMQRTCKLGDYLKCMCCIQVFFKFFQQKILLTYLEVVVIRNMKQGHFSEPNSSYTSHIFPHIIQNLHVHDCSQEPTPGPILGQIYRHNIKFHVV